MFAPINSLCFRVLRMVYRYTYNKVRRISQLNFQSQEKIFKLDFKTFIKSPFTYIFFILLTMLIVIGRYIITSKDNEIKVQQKKIDDCDDERKADKKLMQDILFQKQLNDKLNGE